MKKIINRLIIAILVLSNIILLYNIYDLKKEVLSYKENYKKSRKNMISMMLETDTNSKTYIQSTDSTWPSEDYMFNEEMSKCEQGSKLSWDDTNKKVVMEGNSSDKCYVFFDKYSPITINNYSITSSGNKITITIDATSGTGTISKYYYSKDDGVTYIESTSNNYVFTSLDKGTYKIKAYVEDSNGKKSTILSKTIEITTLTIADYIISQYTGTQGENGLYYHDYTLSNGAGESSYRYAGANPNNYICFGSEESTCPDDNLYRIIGVFGDYNHGVTNKNLVKIIKNTSYGSIAFDDTKSNNWTTATLNTTLNATFLTSNLSGYEDKIETVIWKIGGYNNNAVTAKTFFDSEVTHAARTYQGKIGLMYISDYGFATTPDYWTTNLKSYDTNAKNYDWIYTAKSTKWSITPLSNGTVTGASEWYINGDGALGYTNANDPATVYPCFYLSTSVSYILGTGTSTDPYRVG